MRQHPLDYPNILIRSPIIRKRMRDVPNCVLHADANHPYIFFNKYNNKTEDEILYSIIHETHHWAMRMYLSDSEIKAMNVIYSLVLDNSYTPFEEYINPNPGEYDMSDWLDLNNRSMLRLSVIEIICEYSREGMLYG